VFYAAKGTERTMIASNQDTVGGEGKLLRGYDF
jgi:hypothetical protein